MPKSQSNYLFLQRIAKKSSTISTEKSCVLLIKIFKVIVYYQLFALFLSSGSSVCAVYIFPVRLSPNYYIPEIGGPNYSPTDDLFFTRKKNGLKYSHSSKTTKEITNDFLAKVSSHLRQPSKSTGRQAKSETNLSPTVQLFPHGDTSLQNKSMVDDKLVLIIYKLPVRKKIADSNMRRKRQLKLVRPASDLYTTRRRYRSSSYYTPPTVHRSDRSDRSMSFGNRLRSWWDIFYSGKPATSVSKYRHHNSPRQSYKKYKTALRGKLTGQYSLSPLRYYNSLTSSRGHKGRNPHYPGFDDPAMSGCQPRGPKFILCSTDRIEKLSRLLERFMHYHDRNNHVNQRPPHRQRYREQIDDFYESHENDVDIDNYGPPKRNKGNKYIAPFNGNPSVVVLAVNPREGELEEGEQLGEEEESDLDLINSISATLQSENKVSPQEHENPLVMLVKGAARPGGLLRGKRYYRKLKGVVDETNKHKLNFNLNEMQNTPLESGGTGAQHGRGQDTYHRYKMISSEQQKRIDKYEETLEAYNRLRNLLGVIKQFQEKD